MHYISLNAVTSLTGMSVRTLWRRIANGDFRTCKDDTPAGRKLVALEDLVVASRVPLDPADFPMIVAADSGDPEAQCDFGMLLLEHGVEEDGMRWLATAAERFCPEAMYQYGRCVLLGIAKARDESEGLKWVSRAAERGHVPAMRLLPYLRDPSRPMLSASALESELETLERKIVLDALRATSD